MSDNEHQAETGSSDNEPTGANRLRGSDAEELSLHRVVCEQLPLAIAAKDAPSGRYEFVNRAAQEVFGLPREKIIGKTARDLFDPDMETYAAETDRKAIESKSTVKMPSVRINHRLLRAKKIPLFDERGVARHLLVIAEEISEYEAETGQMRELARDLERSNRDLEQFAYAASHDLQEPLRAVAGYCTLLQRRYADQLDERAQGYITHAVEGAERMRRLIEALLTYSRVTRRGEPFTATDLDKLLVGVLDSLAPAIAESEAEVTSDPLPTLEADATQVAQVLQNLVGNAIKYHRKGVAPHVQISAEELEEHWQISVADNGIGIEPKHFSRIFGVFTRLHTRDEYPGTGLGLALCQRIVERHGGEIWVTSKPESGSTFRFTLRKNLGSSPEQVAP